MKCELCPVAAGTPCKGEDHPIICRKYAAGDVLDAPPPAGPSLPQKVVNLAAAAFRHAANGLAAASADARERRLAICEGCPHHARGTCTVCGCNLAIKTAWAGEACPIGRWPALPAGAEPPAPVAAFATAPPAPAANPGGCCGG